MDPDAAAAYALGGDGAAPPSPGMGFGSAGGPLDRLFDGDCPGPSVGEIEMNYGLSKHWAVFMRGVVRVATGSGIPPIVEIAFGGALAFLNSQKAGKVRALPSGDGTEGFHE